MAGTLRFEHSDAHLREAAQAAGLTVAYFAAASTRREGSAEAHGRLVALAKSQSPSHLE
jgi:predicted TPR repeat methyltransferase